MLEAMSTTSRVDALRELGRPAWGSLVAPLRALDMNTLFARAVLEQEAPGRVFVDSIERPSVVYVTHAYGMSLLFGTSGDPDRDDRIAAHVIARHRAADEWLQVSPQRWAARFADPRVGQFTRVNFRFSPEAFRASRARRAADACPLVPVDRATFELAGGVVPRAFWTDADQFLAQGAGFAAIVDGEPGALAFSAFVTDTQLEIGIETAARHRGRGLAWIACAALIDHCLARHLEPVWACRLENTASHRLAEALGFEPARHLPYFCLTPSERALL
jgi:RimJ/RimL family protein N-acetyltransferase